MQTLYNIAKDTTMRVLSTVLIANSVLKTSELIQNIYHAKNAQKARNLSTCFPKTKYAPLLYQTVKDTMELPRNAILVKTVSLPRVDLLFLMNLVNVILLLRSTDKGIVPL